MSLVGRAGEIVARRINRRRAIKRSAAMVFGAFAAWSAKGIVGSQQLAEYCSYVTTGDCSCNPPYGTYCNAIDGSYCSGSSCSGGCVFDESFRYVGACWCSATCQYTDEAGAPLTGYYKCCDCNCYGQQCACREFIPVAAEAPVPPAPGGGDGGGGRGGRGPRGGFGDDSDDPTVPGTDFPPGFPFDER